MSTRVILAEGLDHALDVMNRLALTEGRDVTCIEIVNAKTNIKKAAKHLRAEQAAVNLLCEQED